jgi:hypothetical protein
MQIRSRRVAYFAEKLTSISAICIAATLTTAQYRVDTKVIFEPFRTVPRTKARNRIAHIGVAVGCVLGLSQWPEEEERSFRYPFPLHAYNILATAYIRGRSPTLDSDDDRNMPTVPAYLPLYCILRSVAPLFSSAWISQLGNSGAVLWSNPLVGPYPKLAIDRTNSQNRGVGEFRRSFARA